MAFDVSAVVARYASAAPPKQRLRHRRSARAASSRWYPAKSPDVASSVETFAPEQTEYQRQLAAMMDLVLYHMPEQFDAPALRPPRRLDHLAEVIVSEIVEVGQRPLVHLVQDTHDRRCRVVPLRVEAARKLRQLSSKSEANLPILFVRNVQRDLVHRIALRDRPEAQFFVRELFECRKQSCPHLRPCR